MLLRLINITDLGSLDRLVSNPSHDLVKLVGGSMTCRLDPLVTSPFNDLMKLVRGFMTCRSIDVL